MTAIEHFSTRLVPAPSRHIVWQKIVAAAFPGMTTHAPEGIRAELAHWSLGPIGLARALSDRAQVSRMGTEDARPHLLLHLLRRGTMVMRYDDQHVQAGPGDIVIADDRRAYAFDISRSNDCMILQLPLSLLGEGSPSRDWHGQWLPSHDPQVGLLFHLLQGIWMQRDRFDELDADTSALLIDAARMACRRAMRPDVPALHLSSPVDFALAHLDHPDLNTGLISVALNLSERAVQKSFFRHVGQTPTAFIMTKRLERASAMLAAGDGRTITDIAFEVGYNDSAFFTRCFRRCYGASPSQWRHRSLLS
ncbi:AraC family transcriptional regulator [Sphingobium sp. YR768]|uniref:AraC family transcriptional regulator n=1 Tax=Sphingobium sp. YR768 TaxID=1884365 RepID=UPI0008C2937A|nr:AraC family transcriptional regulator [Sphingobium sp. YR768]SES04252.1 transcriptional regulator, AraC family [Sphingobium sp. YR768]